jgi:hypothetical protein
MTRISTIVMSILTLMLLAMPQKAVPVDQTQVTTETEARQRLLGEP